MTNPGYDAYGRTSAKSPGRKVPKRVYLICPVCGGRFSLNYAEYRKYVAKGVRPTDSRGCGKEYARQRRTGIIRQDIADHAVMQRKEAEA